MQVRLEERLAPFGARGSGCWALAAQARYLSAEKPNGLGSPEQTFEMWWTGAGISWRSGRR
jgi:hypothetical protein